MRLTRPLAGLWFVAAGILACGNEPTPPPAPVPTSIEPSTTNVALNALGASQQITATVRDQNDQPIAGLALTFVSDDPAVASVSGNGLVTAEGNGNTTVTVSHGSVSVPVTVAVSQIVTQLVKTAGDQQLGPVATELPVAVEVELRDSRDNPVPGGVVPNATVQFTAANGGSVSAEMVTANANGRASTLWTLGPAEGINQLTVTLFGGSASAIFSATAGAVSIALNDGNNQDVPVGTATGIRPSVIVRAPGGAPVAGVSVTFAVTAGGGTVTDETQVTGADGIARVGQWTVGAAAGTNTLSASAADGSITGGPIVFTALAMTTGYDIVLRPLTALSAPVQAAFDSAEKRWQRLVVGDLSTITVNASAGQCGSNSPAVNESVDDLLILVTVEAIDGPGGVLGSAGPCFIRSADSLTVMGQMRFDIDDLAALEASGQLASVVLHEMGHVLGIGSLWSFFGLLQNPSLPSSPGADTHFDGPEAIEAFDSLGGTSYTGGAKVPVENTLFGEGTRDSHWRESVFDEELMTGVIENAPAANPLSRMSVASLVDLGYVVDLTQADSYSHIFTGAPVLRAAGTGELVLKNDVIRGPIVVVDQRGRVLRVVQP